MKFLLLVYLDEGAAATPPPDRGPSSSLARYSRELRDAGVHLDGERLGATRSAYRVQVRDDEVDIAPGSRPSGSERLRGYYLLNVPELEAALDWAARCPDAEHGVVEVWPIAER